MDFRIANEGMVSGLVVDAVTGAPVDGAQLETTGGVSAQTESGVYGMAHPAGTFSLSVSKDGYVTAQQSLTVTDGGRAEVNIALAPADSAGGCLLQKSLPAGSPKLEALRRFRDEVLAKSALGRAAIQAYYSLSPAAVDLIEDNAFLQEKVGALAGWLAKCVQNK
jgi:hypothetical protein